MAEAELHRERLQAIAEKRKRQTEIEDKRQLLEDQILQLQHLKSKLLREKWLMQGTAAPSAEEEEARRQQSEEEEQKVKQLEDNVHRLGEDIKTLECEESQISAKEQIIREKLREAETSFQDLQKSFASQDGDAVNHIYSQIPDLRDLYPQRAEAIPGQDRTYKAHGAKAKHVQFEDQRRPPSPEIPVTESPTKKPPKLPTADDEDKIKLKATDRNGANCINPTDNVFPNKATMEFEVPISEHKANALVTSSDPIDNPANFFSPVASHNGLHHQHESIDSDVVKEIQYLDEVLEANCYDSTAENAFNGTSSPEPRTAIIDGAAPSVKVSNHGFIQKEIVVVDRKQPPVVDEITSNVVTEQYKSNGHSPCEMGEEPYDVYRYPGSPSSSNSSRRSSKDGEMPLTTIKKEAKFELRAFHEDKKPAKLFEDIDEKDRIRVRKVRPTEEVIELEKERRELIRSQAVKKNPGIAAKWWNPPQEKSLEEQLDEEHLESHKKYKERKQQQQVSSTTPPKPKSVSFVPPEPVVIKKEDIVTEQIDFSAARKQFLSMENTSQTNHPVAPRRSVAPKLFTVKPFYKSLSPTQAKKPTASASVTGPVTQPEQIVRAGEENMSVVKASKVSFSHEDDHATNHSSLLEEPQEPTWSGASRDDLPAKAWSRESEFMSATAIFTVVKEDDQDLADNLFRSISISSPPDESDSGLDELSVKSQDTTVFETLSNDFSMDNISDSGASNETMSALRENSLGDFSQPQTPQTNTPTEYRLEGISKSYSDHGFYSPSSTLLDSMLLDDQLKYHAGLLVQNAIEQALAEQAEREGLNKEMALVEQQAYSEQETQMGCVETSTPSSPDVEEQESAVLEQCPVSSPVQEKCNAITIPNSLSYQQLELGEEKSLAHSLGSSSGAQVIVEENRQEGGYFSKYSEAAELRSTAEVQEPEVTVGPFKLRSRKQRTLSMIEEEIRAAQDREEELKRQRQRLQNPPSPVGKTAPALPTRTVQYKTVPGKIEKIRSPSSPTAEGFPSDLELLSEDAAGNQRPKNLMQTLLQDFESHKTKRRERTDDSSYVSKCLCNRVTSEVIEATRVNRRKSALALRWEAGIYANREEDE
ncbi:PALM2-AKAP2 fusion protein isoform X3 [Ambystoma mexicanum]|uniref:PALM2-AKAP2 fusion protein isoform X3 n=1 Tax=Ambystoma mexicanum TaxID=8296 RepID=UPI0037E76BF0